MRVRVGGFTHVLLQDFTPELNGLCSKWIKSN